MLLLQINKGKKKIAFKLKKKKEKKNDLSGVFPNFSSDLKSEKTNGLPPKLFFFLFIRSRYYISHKA